MQRESLSRDARAPRFAWKVQRPGELCAAKWAGDYTVNPRHTLELLMKSMKSGM